MVFRRHPAIKIDEVWLDHYHGGTVPADEPHPFAMTGVVVARSYIGPMNTGTPSRSAVAACPDPGGEVVVPDEMEQGRWAPSFALPDVAIHVSGAGKVVSS